MRVSSGSNPYPYQQKRTSGNKKDDFSLMYAHMTRTRPQGNQITITPQIATETDLRSEDKFVFGTQQHYIPPDLEVIEYKIPIPPKPESIYDIPVSELWIWFEAAEKASDYNIDKTGMTKTELYNSVKSMFEDYLGKDFLEAELTSRGKSHETIMTYQRARTTFEMVLEANGFDTEDGSRDMIAARGYTGLSKDEMYAAVRKQYPETMALRECIVMARELANLDVTTTYDYGMAVNQQIFWAIAMYSPEASGNMEEIFGILLDLPADFDTIVSDFEKHQKDMFMYSYREQYQDPVTRLLQKFRVSDGHLYTGAAMDRLSRLLR
jgi:hypothetical protein